MFDIERETMNTKWINRILKLVVLVALVSSAAPVLAARAAAQLLPVETLLNSGSTPNTGTGASVVMGLRGWNVMLDSARGPILSRHEPVSDALNADMWSALANNSLNNYVYALAVSGSDLYVGGGFTRTADGMVTNLGSIARYSNGAWYPLAHNGLNGVVWALAMSGSDLYVGGSFTETADGKVTNLNNLARYSSGTWYPLAHNGLDTAVEALAVSGSNLYVGGYFTQTADGKVTNLNHIARYNGGAWLALANNGLMANDVDSGNVSALAMSGSDLYVGGWYFTQTADGKVTNLNNIARYSGSTWSALSNKAVTE